MLHISNIRTREYPHVYLLIFARLRKLSLMDISNLTFAQNYHGPFCAISLLYHQTSSRRCIVFFPWVFLHNYSMLTFDLYDLITFYIIGRCGAQSIPKQPSDLFPAPLYSRSTAVRLSSQQQNSLLITKEELFSNKRKNLA